jgi:hypothetical protein
VLRATVPNMVVAPEGRIVHPGMRGLVPLDSAPLDSAPLDSAPGNVLIVLVLVLVFDAFCPLPPVSAMRVGGEFSRSVHERDLFKDEDDWSPGTSHPRAEPAVPE